MRITKSIEQGIYVMLILSLQKDHTPVKSSLISQILETSDSYTKKILRKLVLAGLINSNASKDGGFTLVRSIRSITVLDIYKALESDSEIPGTAKMAEKIFEDIKHIKSGEKKVFNIFEEAIEDFYARLKTLPLSELLKEIYIDSGYCDWQSKWKEADS